MVTQSKKIYPGTTVTGVTRVRLVVKYGIHRILFTPVIPPVYHCYPDFIIVIHCFTIEGKTRVNLFQFQGKPMVNAWLNHSATIVNYSATMVLCLFYSHIRSKIHM